MTSRLLLTLGVMIVCVATAACDSQQAGVATADGALSGRLVMTGSSTVAPLATEIARRFESRHPGVRIDVQSGGSSRGISDARQALADIGMVSRDLKAAEKDLVAYPLARDGIGVIVHADNPVTRLDRSQVVAIYRGEISNWRQVGGVDKAITVVNKAEGRSTLELFLKHFQLKNSDIDADVVIGDNEQGIKTIAGNPWAIGYVSIGTAEYDIDLGVTVKLLPMGQVPASTVTVANGQYPLSRTLNLVTLPRVDPLTMAFIEFARSPAVHDIVREQSFVAYVQ